MVLAQSDLPFDSAMLPMTETLTEYISNSMCHMVSDEEGILLTLQGPLGPGALMSLSVSFLDYLIRNDLLQGFLAQSPVGEESATVPYLADPDLGEVFTLKQDKKYAEAAARLDDWLSDHPDRGWFTVWAYNHRGDCRMALERYEDAMEDYLQVAKRDADSRGQAYYNIARACGCLNDPTTGMRYLEKAIVAGYRIFEDDPELKGLKEDPGYEALLGLVVDSSFLIREGRHADAAELLTEWIFNHPYHGITAWALKNRGDCLLKQERHTEAISDFEKAAKAEQSYQPQIYYNLACLCALRDEPDRAVDYLKRAMDAGFDDFDLLNYDGDLDSIRDDLRFKALRWRW
jgi:tetratricopeptide (TPR) repeat protein